MNRQHVNVSGGEQINSYCTFSNQNDFKYSNVANIHVCKRKDLRSLLVCYYRLLWNIEGGTKHLPYV